jgi:hypothetical protein
MLRWDGMSSASRTCSRRYCQGRLIPRLGLLLRQCGPSVFQSSHRGQSSDGCHLPAEKHLSQASRWQTNANHASFSTSPARIWRLYSRWRQQTDSRSNPLLVISTISALRRPLVPARTLTVTMSDGCSCSSSSSAPWTRLPSRPRFSDEMGRKNDPVLSTDRLLTF